MFFEFQSFYFNLFSGLFSNIPATRIRYFIFFIYNCNNSSYVSSSLLVLTMRLFGGNLQKFFISASYNFLSSCYHPLAALKVWLFDKFSIQFFLVRLRREDFFLGKVFDKISSVHLLHVFIEREVIKISIKVTREHKLFLIWSFSSC